MRKGNCKECRKMEKFDDIEREKDRGGMRDKGSTWDVIERELYGVRLYLHWSGIVGYSSIDMNTFPLRV